MCYKVYIYLTKQVFIGYYVVLSSGDYVVLSSGHTLSGNVVLSSGHALSGNVNSSV